MPFWTKQGCAVVTQDNSGLPLQDSQSGARGDRSSRSGAGDLRMVLDPA